MFPTKFGIEIEVLGLSCNDNHILKLFRRANAEHFFDRNENYWGIHEDCSVKNCDIHDHFTEDCDEDCHIEEGIEFVSPPFEFCNESFADVTEFFDTLNALDSFVNPTCGFHVHIDASFIDNYRDDEKKREFFTFIRRLYAEYEDVFDGRMPSGRQKNHNQFCRSMKNLSSPIQSGFRLSNRYFKLNTESYFRHGTIEFRHHHGTLDANEAVSWIKTCGLFIAFARQEFEKTMVENNPLDIAV